VRNVVLTKVTRNGQLTLPAAIRRAFHVEEGDYIEVRAAEEGIILVPKKIIDKSQAYFWSASWQIAEKEASEDIASGRVAETPSMDALIKRLDKTRNK
jgi:antitoxin MazE